jgi:hypothetical protein
MQFAYCCFLCESEDDALEQARRISLVGATVCPSGSERAQRGAEPGRPGTANWPGTKSDRSQPIETTRRIISQGEILPRGLAFSLGSAKRLSFFSEALPIL